MRYKILIEKEIETDISYRHCSLACKYYSWDMLTGSHGCTCFNQILNQTLDRLLECKIVEDHWDQEDQNKF
jgi:hypothetical protein